MFFALYMEQTMNNTKNKSLHPFQLVWNGEMVAVQRGLVFNVNDATPFEVESATVDLRFNNTESWFPPDTDISIHVETDESDDVFPGESMSILSAKIILGANGILIGRVSNGIVNQSLRSDVYLFLASRPQ